MLSNPLIVRKLLAQVGTFHPDGVAVTSQILCISITLNKRNMLLWTFSTDTLQRLSLAVKYFFQNIVYSQLSKSRWTFD